MPVTISRPSRLRDQLDRRDERLRKLAADRRDQRRDAVGLGLERAQRRRDQRGCRSRPVRASDLPFVNVSVTARPVSTDTARKATCNATLTILVLHPLTISRASRGREGVPCGVSCFRCSSGRRRRGRGRARGGACVRAAGRQTDGRPAAFLRRSAEVTAPRDAGARAPCASAVRGRCHRQSGYQPPSFGNPPGSGASRTGSTPRTRNAGRRHCARRARPPAVTSAQPAPLSLTPPGACDDHKSKARRNRGEAPIRRACARRRRATRWCAFPTERRTAASSEPSTPAA